MVEVNVIDARSCRDVLPGDTFVLDGTEYPDGIEHEPVIHQPSGNPSPVAARYVPTSLTLRAGTRALVIAKDEEQPWWFLVLAEGVLGWICYTDVATVEREVTDDGA